MTKNILVIDDEKSIRKAFTLALEDTEFHVDTAASGEEGLEQQANKQYDLVFLDLKMPGMNGVETLRRLRDIDPMLPIYVVTAFHKEFLTELGVLSSEGISFELVRKPIGADDIVKITEGVLGEGPVSY